MLMHKGHRYLMRKSHLYRTFIATWTLFQYLIKNNQFILRRDSKNVCIYPQQVKETSEIIFNTIPHYAFPSYITYQKDGLATMHNADFISDPRFENAYLSGKHTGSWGSDYDLEWRIKVLCWAADHVKNLSGDFVECGTHKGGTAMAVSRYVEFEKLNKTFFLLDTFGELHEEGGLDPQNDAIYQLVCKLFTGYNTKIIKGFIPDTLSQITAEKIVYLMIDLNNHTVEVSVLNYLWERIVPGGVIVLDDYGWPGRIDQKLAHDYFAAQKGLEILPLPTGQGLLIKPNL